MKTLESRVNSFSSTVSLATSLSNLPGIKKMKAAAPTFKNGDFESNGFTTGSYKYKVPASWRGTRGTVAAKNGNRPWGGLDSGNGNYYYSIQSDGSYLEQTVTLVKGATYTITFLATHRPGYGSDEKLRIKIRNSGSSYITIWHRDYMPEKFMEFSATFTALRNDQYIRFENDSPAGDRSVFIDEIRIS